MGVAKALWSIYQYALPQVPGVMSARIYEYLNENGYLRGNGMDDLEQDLVQDYVQKVPADQMCWMHLKEIGKCGCDFVEVGEND